MRTLLLTRPRAQSEDFAAALAAALPGRFRPIVSPLVEIAPIEAEIDLDGIAALVFTSANGVAAFADRRPDIRGLPAYCVGASTAAAARAAGLAARSAEGDAVALAALIRRDRPGPLLHLRGAHAAAELATILSAEGLPAREAVLYEQRPLPASAEAEALGRAGHLDVLTAFSPRGARALARRGGGLGPRPDA
jgi:uroporphyrinogen-III synthase